MYSLLFVLFLITGQLLLTANGVLANLYFGAGKRIDGDQLLLKDVQHSRPASDPPRVVFTYNIEEPITYIEITSEENISAMVQFSYTNSLVVGIVSRYDNASTGDAEVELVDMIIPTEFDVTIKIYGFNDTRMNFNPTLLLNRDTHYEGQMLSYKGSEEKFDMFQEEYVEPISNADFESKDKLIEVGERQEGDDLLFEIYQTSPEMPTGQSEYTLYFYYIDSDYITYVKFVLYDHFLNKQSTAVEYKAPDAVYTHYSPGTLKAAITDYNITSMFVQMFVYGYRGANSAPPGYTPFLPPPRSLDVDETTLSLMDIQLTLLKNGMSSESAEEVTDEDGEEAMRPDDMVPDHMPEPRMRPEDILPDHMPEPRSVKNAALGHQGVLGQRLYALLGLMLFALA